MNVEQKDSIAKRTITRYRKNEHGRKKVTNAKRSPMQKDHIRKRRWMAL